MLRIYSIAQLKQYKRQRALVTWFLDNGYSDKNIKVVMQAKLGFDAHVGSSWHMLIPYKDGGYAIDIPLSSGFYGIELSRSVIDRQGIPTSKLPVILFENYDADSDYFYVSLAGMSENEMIVTMGEIADIVVHEYSHGRSDPKDYRFDITQRVKAHTNIKRLISFVKRSASTAIGVAVGLL